MAKMLGWPDNWNDMIVACENDDVYDLTALLRKHRIDRMYVPLSLFNKLFRITVSYDKFQCFEKLLHTAKFTRETYTDAIKRHELGQLAIRKKRMSYLEYLVAMMSTESQRHDYVSELLVDVCRMGYISAVKILVTCGTTITYPILFVVTSNYFAPREFRAPHKHKRNAQLVSIILMNGVEQQMFERAIQSERFSMTEKTVIESMAHQSENCY